MKVIKNIQKIMLIALCISSYIIHSATLAAPTTPSFVSAKKNDFITAVHFAKNYSIDTLLNTKYFLYNLKDTLYNSPKSATKTSRALFKKVILYRLRKNYTLTKYETEFLKKNDPLSPISLLPDHHTTMQGPTLSYIKHNAEKLNQKLENHYKSYIEKMDIDSFIQLTQDIIKAEDEIHKKNCFSLVHGESSEFHINQKCFDVLMGRKDIDFVSTRFETDFSEKNKAASAQKRKKYLESGCKDDDLFMGYSLFSHGPTESPIYFYLLNFSFNRKYITPETIFAQFKQQDMYNTFRHELKDLAYEYKRICPAGQVLVFSFAHDALEQSAYPAKPYGKKIAYPKGTANTLALVKALKNNPTKIDNFDSILFCHTPTVDYAFQPDIAGKKIKVYTITGANPDKMSAYLAKEKKIFDKIEAALIEKNHTFIGRQPSIAYT